MSQPPQILRIKRKRGQDPLQALILEDLQRPKRSKQSSPVLSKPLTPVLELRSWVFQLSGTDNKTQMPDPDVLALVLSEAVSSEEKRRFVIPKAQTEEDTVIPHELSDMLDSFLTVNDTATPKKKRRGGKPVEIEQHHEKEAQTTKNDGFTSEADANQPESHLEDYVFDVYKLTSTEPLTNDNYPLSQIGYIRFFDDDEYDLLQSDDEHKSRTHIYSDDEDSNAESFYQNDYPEDEDAGTYSDTYERPFGGEEDEEEDDEYGNDDDNIGPVIIDLAEDAEGHAYLQGHFQADLVDERQFDNIYDNFFDDENNTRVDFLQQDDDYSEVAFERQNFFEGEEDDAMAIHRDRIFGKLQRMIDEQDT